MKVIELKNIGKRFSLSERRQQYLWAVKDISLDVGKGEIAGIIGRNGSGKTTLLKTIAGLIQPTQGALSIKGRICSLFSLGAGFQDKLSGKENIFLNGSLLGMSDMEIKRKYRNIVDFSELDGFINLPLGSYSQGMRLRLGFSIAAHIDFDILLIDEVLLVGDGAFQNKCFEKLKDFRREGKTMFITTQSLDLIERLCDKVFLLENGRLEDGGEPARIIDAYRKLLNEDRKKLRVLDSALVVKKTKWWAEDRSEWGRKEGTKEVIIESVNITNRWGRKTCRFNVGDKVKIKVSFVARDKIKEPKFGVALFREDGVYCYGPNTSFDGHAIRCLGRGKGWFVLEYKNLLLMPGRYYLSVAIWDKKEILAYDYHKYFYKIEIIGINKSKQLLHLPSFWNSRFMFANHRRNTNNIDISWLEDKWLQRLGSDQVGVDLVELLDSSSNQKKTFFTGEKMQVNLRLRNESQNGDLYIWSGIFRKDTIFCHGTSARLAPSRNTMCLLYPKLYLLPGEYRLSIGVWDRRKDKFLASHHGTYPFQVFFSRPDHGTVYLEHKWKWRLPQER